MDIAQRTDESGYTPINCVICKKKMNYALIVTFCEFDMNSAGENTLLNDVAKKEELNDIQLNSYHEDW